jgi:hypothetical protein
MEAWGLGGPALQPFHPPQAQAQQRLALAERAEEEAQRMLAGVEAAGAAARARREQLDNREQALRVREVRAARADHDGNAVP